MKPIRLYLLIFLLLGLCRDAMAGNALSGKITDGKGLGLQGAVIEITDLKTGAAADSDGTYRISNLPKGTYLVEVHLLSYGTLNTQVTIDGETKKDFTLSESYIEKNAVVVTGLSLATEERQSITPIQSIGIQEMHQNASTNVIDAIANLPGVTALTTGISVSKPVIRGLGYNRIITLNDGVRQEGQQWGDEHGIEIDDYNVTRIEVLKGPASLAYGSDALAGVVNIISNPDIPEGKINGNVTTNYQTNSGLAALHADLGGNEHGFSWKVYGTGKMSHDYQDKYDGYVYDTRFQNVDYGATIGVNRSWGSSRLTYTSFNEKTGIPEGTRDTATGTFLKDVNLHNTDVQQLVTNADGRNYAMTVPYQHIYHQKLVWDDNIYLGNGGRIGFNLGYQRNRRMEFNDVLEPDAPGLSLELRTATYDLKYFMPMISGWEVSVGVNGMTQWNFNKGTEFLVPDYNLFDGGVYGMGKKNIGKWTVAGGIRYDMRKIESYGKDSDPAIKQKISAYEIFKPFTDNFSNISGSLGVGYNLNAHTIFKFNFASGYRSPNIAELSANGVHDGTYRYEIGNTGLHPEHSYQCDLGVNWSSKHLMVNAALFNNYIENYIYIRKLDSIPIYANPGKYSGFIYTQGAANLYGGEIFADYHPALLEWLHLENTFSYVRGNLSQSIEGTNNLPYMPPPRWLVELKAQPKAFTKFLKNPYAKVGLDVNWAQNNVFTAYGTETPCAGYTLLNAGVGADIMGAKHQNWCTLTITANNLTNVAYQNSLSRLRYTDENLTTGRMGIFNPGRNFSFMVSVPLDVK